MLPNYVSSFQMTGVLSSQTLRNHTEWQSGWKNFRLLSKQELNLYFSFQVPYCIHSLEYSNYSRTTNFHFKNKLCNKSYFILFKIVSLCIYHQQFLVALKLCGNKVGVSLAFPALHMLMAIPGGNGFPKILCKMRVRGQSPLFEVHPFLPGEPQASVPLRKVMIRAVRTLSCQPLPQPKCACFDTSCAESRTLLHFMETYFRGSS